MTSWMSRRAAAFAVGVAVLIVPLAGADSGSTRGKAPAHDGPITHTEASTFVAALQAQPGQASQQPAKTDEFVPVSELPKQEQLPAAPLLIAAYAVVWISLLAYVFMLWRRLARVEKEISTVARQIDTKRRD